MHFLTNLTPIRKPPSKDLFQQWCTIEDREAIYFHITQCFLAIFGHLAVFNNT